MTSAPIMEMAQTGFVPTTSSVKQGSGVEATQFSAAMDYASAGEQSEAVKAPPVQENGDDAKIHAEKSAAENGGRKEIRKADEAEETKPASEEETAKQLQNKTEEAVEEIAAELDVSSEAVEEAMAALGLTVMDLISQGNMAALVAEIKGMQSVELLTDADLFSQITQLAQGTREEFTKLAESLGMTVEDLEQYIKDNFSAVEESTNQGGIEKVLPQITGTEVTETIREVNEATEFAEDIKDVQMPKEVVAKDNISQKEQEIESKKMISADDSKGKTDLVKTIQEIATQEGEMSGENLGKESGQEFGEEQESLQNGNFLEQTTGKDLNLVENQKSDLLFEGEFDVQKTRELIDQIADYVKVHHSEKVSSMEIQLNPASLGTVNLQVVAKDGIISAQLATRDDAVRAALESQVVQLKESLEAQGLKIDAVEVTVASHAFEQNLQQQNQDTQQQAAKERKGARKILNLDEMEQDGISEEEMSDADRLQIEMMRMGGNKLNFRV